MTAASLDSSLLTRGRYNIQAVSRRTGVPAPTIRAWERRYGLPRPGRTEGRQRLYSDDDVHVIEWLRARTAEGVSAARAAALWRDQAAVPHPPLRSVGEAPEVLSEALFATLLRHDPAEAESAISQALALYDTETVCSRVIRPALVDIGECWHRGEVEVATEHLATQVVRSALGSLLRLVTAEHDGPLVLVATPAGELHELGALMLAIAAARRGLQVRFLGANVPSDSLQRLAATLRPAGVTLSATVREHVAELARAAALLTHSAHPPKIALGGQAFEQDPGLADGIPGLLLVSDLAAAATQLGALLAADRSAQ